MRWVAPALAVLALGALPSTAAADLPAPGPNGKIAFTSARGQATNASSQLWMMDGIASTPQALTNLGTRHYRHPVWSPDHTKIAYARTDNIAQAFTGPWDIYVYDIRLGSTLNITNSVAAEERPSWSPDGQFIAYQKSNGATWDIKMRTPAGGPEQDVAETDEPAAGAFYPRPHWTPNSQTIYFTHYAAAANHDIYKVPAQDNPAGTKGTAVIDSADDDYQPYVSPDGNNICFTRGTAAKNIWRASIDGLLPSQIIDSGDEDYECAWSPDTTKIIFTRGAQTAGEVRVRNSNGTGTIDTVTNDTNGNLFDGNPDWAIDFPPNCNNLTVDVPVNGIASIPLGCIDPDATTSVLAAPAPAPIGSGGLEISTPPGNGTLGSIGNDERVFYTPNLNFKGTDTFRFTGNDDQSGSDIHKSKPATITVRVGTTAAGADKTKPSLTGLKVSPKKFRRGTSLPKLALAKKGTKISFSLSEIAKVKLSFAKAKPGRRVGRSCKKPTRSNRGKRKCTRYVNAGSFTVQGRKGSQKVSFSGKLSRSKRLSLGSYKLTATPTDGSGNKGRARTAKFRIVRR